MQRQMCPLDQGTVASYFHLPQCIRGFGNLLKDLMGVSLEQMPIEPGDLADLVSCICLPCPAGRISCGCFFCPRLVQIMPALLCAYMQVRPGLMALRRCLSCMRAKGPWEPSTWTCSPGAPAGLPPAFLVPGHMLQTQVQRAWPSRYFCQTGSVGVG